MTATIPTPPRNHLLCPWAKKVVPHLARDIMQGSSNKNLVSSCSPCLLPPPCSSNTPHVPKNGGFSPTNMLVHMNGGISSTNMFLKLLYGVLPHGKVKVGAGRDVLERPTTIGGAPPWMLPPPPLPMFKVDSRDGFTILLPSLLQEDFFWYHSLGDHRRRRGPAKPNPPNPLLFSFHPLTP